MGLTEQMIIQEEDEITGTNSWLVNHQHSSRGRDVKQDNLVGSFEGRKVSGEKRERERIGFTNEKN